MNARRTSTASLIATLMVFTSCASTIDKSRVVDAPIEEVWKVLAVDFEHVDQWARSVSHSSPNYAESSVDEVVGRTCESSLGGFVETISMRNAQDHILAYDAVAEDMPFFVRGLSNRWSLTSLSPTSTRVDMHLDADLWPVFNMVMWPIMKGRMNALLDDALDDLETYVVSGEPSDVKRESVGADS